MLQTIVAHAPWMQAYLVRLVDVGASFQGVLVLQEELCYFDVDLELLQRFHFSAAAKMRCAHVMNDHLSNSSGLLG
eukprot:SAG31_NODE_2281_length_6022_cov_3.327706_5_plen_76_part_00